MEYIENPIEIRNSIREIFAFEQSSKNSKSRGALDTIESILAKLAKEGRGEGEGDVEEATRGDPRWNRCSLEYWKTSKRARNRGVGGRLRMGGGAQCEQATIYDAYVNSWNGGDTACSCRREGKRTIEGGEGRTEDSRSEPLRRKKRDRHRRVYICRSRI